MATAYPLAPAAPAAPASKAQPRDALLCLWALFWLLLITVSEQDSWRNPAVSRWEPVLWEGSSALFATCWLLLATRAREHNARYLDRPWVWFARHLLWLPLIVATFIATVYPLRHGAYELVGRHYHHPPWLFVVVYESVKLTLFAGLWTGILFGFDSHAQWQLQRGRLLQLQRDLTEAHLARLKGQLQPHFFFNALNTISALMQVDVARADRLVAGLGDLLHISLRSGEQEMTPLREELRSLELYAHIMQERFRDRVTVSLHADPDIMDVRVPTLVLQPLLENAFKHGVERTTAAVHIDVTARREADLLNLVLTNTGSTLSPGYREGIGLRNSRERLMVIYGPAASLVIGAAQDAVAVRLCIPLTDSSAA
jgi:hypothetical protein